MSSRPLFSIEKDAGDAELSIFLYFGSGETRVRVASTPKDFVKFVEHLEHMTNEIQETYQQTTP